MLAHGEALLPVVFQNVPGDFRGCLADGVRMPFQRAQVLLGEQGLAWNVEPNHGERNAGLENDARGFRAGKAKHGDARIRDWARSSSAASCLSVPF